MRFHYAPPPNPTHPQQVSSLSTRDPRNKRQEKIRIIQKNTRIKDELYCFSLYAHEFLSIPALILTMHLKLVPKIVSSIFKTKCIEY